MSSRIKPNIMTPSEIINVLYYLGTIYALLIIEDDIDSIERVQDITQLIETRMWSSA